MATTKAFEAKSNSTALSLMCYFSKCSSQVMGAAGLIAAFSYGPQHREAKPICL